MTGAIPSQPRSVKAVACVGTAAVSVDVAGDSVSQMRKAEALIPTDALET